MAKKSQVELYVNILGKLDKSLTNSIKSATSQVSSFSSTLSSVGTAGLAAMGALATGTVAALAKCTNAAQEFEEYYANSVKVVEGLTDAAGNIDTEKYAELQDTILDLSTQIPMTAEEINSLVEAAGQSGISYDELFTYDDDGNLSGFIKDVAEVATAMDITSEQAGEWAAKWEPALNMTHDEIMELFDQINYLGNTTSTTAAEIAEVVNGVGSVGSTAGFTASDTAALADAMLAMGGEASTVATSISRMYVNLSKGASATDAQAAMFEELGMTAEGVAEALHEVDENGNSMASSVMIDVLEAIGNMDESRQTTALNTLFGQWAIKDAAKVVENIDMYKDALENLSDSSIYNGSMEHEFSIKANTTESAEEMLQNALYALEVDVGTYFLPAKKKLMKLATNLLNTLRNYTPQISQIAEKLADKLSDGVDKLGDGLEKAMPYIEQAFDYIINNGDKVVEAIAGITAAFTAMKFAPQIETMAGLIGTLFVGDSATNTSKKKGGILGAVQGLFGTKSSKLATAAAGTAASSAGTAAATGAATAAGSAASAAGAAASIAPIASSLGGALASIGVVIAAISTVIALFSILGDHCEAIREIIVNVFGEAGGEAFDVFTGKLKQIGDFIGGLFEGGGVADLLSPIQSMLSGELMKEDAQGGGILSTLLGGHDNGMAAFNGIVEILQAVMGLAGQVADFAVTYVKPILVDIFGFIATTVAPKLTTLIGEAAPLVASIATNMGSSIMGIMQILASAVKLVLPLLGKVYSFMLDIYITVIPLVLTGINWLWTAISTAINAILPLIETVAGKVGEAIDFIKPIIQDVVDFIKPIIQNVIDFLSPLITQAIEIFTGSAADIWESIKTIGKGILDLVVGIFTGDLGKTLEGLGGIFGGAFSAIKTALWVAISNIIVAVQALMPVFEKVKEGIKTAIEFITPIAKSVFGFLVSVFTAGPSVIIDAIGRIWEDIKTVAGGIVDFVTGIFTGDWGQAWEGVKEIFSGVFDGVATWLQTPINAIVATIQALMPVIEKIKTGVKAVIDFVVPIVQSAVSFLSQVITTWLTGFILGVTTVWDGVKDKISTVVNFLAPFVTTGLSVLVSAATDIWENIKTVFNGVVDFVTGVFSGDWEQAWLGVQEIFSGVFSALETLIKTPMNAVIAIINKAIEGINDLGLTIPDWVPLIGGQSFTISIPEIPMLANGGFTNGPSIAGEAGTEAVISFANSERASNIATWAKAGEMLGVDTVSPNAELKEIDTSSGTATQMVFSPNITIQGNADQTTVDYMMAEMKEQFEQWYAAMNKKAARVAY